MLRDLIFFPKTEKKSRRVATKILQMIINVSIEKKIPLAFMVKDGELKNIQADLHGPFEVIDLSQLPLKNYKVSSTIGHVNGQGNKLIMGQVEQVLKRYLKDLKNCANH